MVEGTCLENKRLFTGSVSSNLTASALEIINIGVDNSFAYKGVNILGFNQSSFPRGLRVGA